MNALEMKLQFQSCISCHRKFEPECIHVLNVLERYLKFGDAQCSAANKRNIDLIKHHVNSL